MHHQQKSFFDKNSWDTSTERCFSLLARLLYLPMLFIAVNIANHLLQHWEGKNSVFKVPQCPNNLNT